MGQQTSREHAPLTFGYINEATDINENIESSNESQKDFVLANPHLYQLQATCNHCQNNKNELVAYINEACTKCKRQKRLSLVKRDLAEDLEYVDQTYYPDLVHYTTTTTTEEDDDDTMEKELLEQWSKLTIGDAVTKRPRRLTGPSMAVDLSSKSLVQLSPSIGYLDNLTKLNLSNNQMTHLPREIGYLKNLRVLNISNNMMQEIPDTIAFLTKLKAFNVSHNQLSELPPSIGQLHKIVIIIANNNNLTSLPRQFSQLTQLLSLDVSNNPLKSLPAEIAELASLRKFLTDNCPFEEEYSYNLRHDPPSLFETCARITVRSKMNIPNQFPHHIKHYLSLADTCSYCKGPFFDSYVTRTRFIERKARQIIALEHTLCSAHWSNDEDRLLAMFSQQPIQHHSASFKEIDMNGLHDSTHRYRAYSDTSSNYNNIINIPSTVATSTTPTLHKEEAEDYFSLTTPVSLLRPLPNLPALPQQQYCQQKNRPRASSTASVTKRLTHFIRSNSSPSTVLVRQQSSHELSSKQLLYHRTEEEIILSEQ